MSHPKNIISLTEARKNLFRIADDIELSEEEYTLTSHGHAKVMMISARRYHMLTENRGQSTLMISDGRSIYDHGTKGADTAGEDERAVTRAQLYVTILDTCATKKLYRGYESSFEHWWCRESRLCGS